MEYLVERKVLVMLKYKWEELKDYDNYLGTIVSDFMTRNNVKEIPTGRCDLQEESFVNIDEYDTRDNYNFEAHRKYVDVQLMIDGEEEIFYAPLSCGTVSIPYDEEKDVAFYTCDKKDFFRVELKSGDAVILFPEDIHAPCNFEEKRHNRKLIFKIPLSSLGKV